MGNCDPYSDSPEPLVVKQPKSTRVKEPTLLWRSNASCHSKGCESLRQNIPVTVVVIPSGEEGDRLVGSLEVKVPMAGRTLVRSAQGASNLTGRSKSEPGSPEKSALREADCRIVGRAEPLITWRRPMSEPHVWNKPVAISPGSLRTACQEGRAAKAWNHSKVA
jgi:hypothetical protein